MRVHVINNWKDAPGGWRHPRFWLNAERVAAWRSVTLAGLTFFWTGRARA